MVEATCGKRGERDIMINKLPPLHVHDGAFVKVIVKSEGLGSGNPSTPRERGALSPAITHSYASSSSDCPCP